jgi:transcriptional regulator with XRE-family HTH domain
MTLAATIVREARTGGPLGGLTQRELACRSGLAQPAIAAVESGRKDATSATIEKVLEATGSQILVVPSRLLSATSAARLVREQLAGGSAHGALRTWVQLANDLATAEAGLRVVLTFVPPPLTGDRRYDSLLAALVEHRLTTEGLAVPRWVHEPERTCVGEWYVAGVAGLLDDARQHTPSAFLRHGVIIHEVDLESV